MHPTDETGRVRGGQASVNGEDDEDEDLDVEDEHEGETAAGRQDSRISEQTSEPAIRSHSYLPGASHPLHTTAEARSACSDLAFGVSGATATTDPCRRKNGDPFDLILLELPGVILFPGMTVPLRLEEPGTFSAASAFWRLYQQIQKSRRSPGQAETVQIGVLTKLDPGDDVDNSLVDGGSQQRQPSVNNESQIQRRRSSWMRRSFGPERLRRFSEQIVRELGDVEEFLNSVESVGDAMDEDDDEGDDQRNQQQQEADEATVEFLHRRPRGAGGSGASPTNGASSVARGGATDDTYAGRVGTLATVTYTHGDDDMVLTNGVGGTLSPSPPDPTRPRPRASLILTAVGTGRFCILSKEDSSAFGTNNQRSTEDYFRYHHLFVRTVRDWSPERILPERLCSFAVNATPSVVARINPPTSVSAWPGFVYDHYWPWKLMDEIKARLESAQSLKDMITANHGTELNALPNHPLDFSYWIARHLPLSERERLHVLQCPTVTERLRWFLRHTLLVGKSGCSQTASSTVRSTRSTQSQQPDQQRREQQPAVDDVSDTKELICKSCQIPITSARHLFSLGGAEGTVGNYVNPHGIVHATMTVRSVDPYEVMFQGRPETRDSWFPGYAWTIMSCALCHAHLGWKFTLVDGTAGTSSARPDHFFGLSATGVTMTTNPRRARNGNRGGGGNWRRVRQATDA